VENAQPVVEKGYTRLAAAIGRGSKLSKPLKLHMFE
jgi:hypothetical protein